MRCLMGRRNRERIERIRLGQEPSHREKIYWQDQTRKLEALERVADEFGGELVAEELRQLGQEGKLRI